MRWIEYGGQNRETVLFLHGGGLSWWSCRAAAERLQADYRVILPILDGHAGSDRAFTTIRDNALELISFIDEHCGGKVSCLGGLSLGAQVVLEALCERPNLCRLAVVESARIVPSRLTRAMIAPTFGCSYGLIRMRWFAKLQFRYLGLPKELFEEYYADTCRIRQADMIAFLQENSVYTPGPALQNCQARTAIFVGGKEIPTMRRSAKRLQAMIPGSTLEILPGCGHGTFSICRPGDYADRLRTLMQGNE